MTLQSSGTISMSNIDVELGSTATTALTLNDSTARNLAGIASGQIALNNFYGKTNTLGTAGNPASSAKALYNAGYRTDGVYYINLPSVGSTPVYCLLNSGANGGGWMMALKATRGTTFNYNSGYWTGNNTLNTSATNRNDGDAKFQVFNYANVTDMMALWPDIGTNGGGLGSNPYGCWSWLQNNFAGQGDSPNVSSTTTLLNFFSNAGTYQDDGSGSAGGDFLGGASGFNGFQTGIFSSQNDINFYGYNFINAGDWGYGGGAAVRWGFGWNENGEGQYSDPSTLFNSGAAGSDDVSGGLGMAGNFGNYSAGDYVACCQNQTGINRSARVELYVR